MHGKHEEAEFIANDNVRFADTPRDLNASRRRVQSPNVAVKIFGPSIFV
jgi:hypothetical protein